MGTETLYEIAGGTRYDRALGNLAQLNDGWAETQSAPTELFHRLRFVLLDELVAAETEIASLRSRAKAAEEMAEDIKVTAIFEVDGRNEAERKANLVRLLEGHGPYNEARASQRKAESELTEVEVRFRRLQREWQVLTLQSQLRIAVLNFLSSEQ